MIGEDAKLKVKSILRIVSYVLLSVVMTVSVCSMATIETFAVAGKDSAGKKVEKKVEKKIEKKIELRFKAQGGRVNTAKKTVVLNKTYGKLPAASRTDYKFDGWWTKKTGGTRILSSTKVKSAKIKTLYAHWIKQYKLKFDANGGKLKDEHAASRTRIYEQRYGTLPAVSMDGYKFLGWYTEQTGGVKIKSTDLLTAKKNLTFYAQWKRKIRIACIGDSNTYGFEIRDIGQSWPNQLGQLLGDDYLVNNFGSGGRGVIFASNDPYIDSDMFEKSYNFKPDIVISFLGNHDTKNANFVDMTAFMRDYDYLINFYKMLPSKPDIYLVSPITNEIQLPYGAGHVPLVSDMRKQLKEYASKSKINHIEVADMINTDDRYWQEDRKHLNMDGASCVAYIVYSAIMEWRQNS
jgi:uncharacterized repeat protein (TIGR02543 family)